MRKFKFKDYWSILKKAGEGFGHHKILRLSASLAFYTLFSIGPMIMVIIFISTLLLKRQAIEGTVYHNLSEVIGSGAALQVQEIIKNASITGNAFAVVLGFLILIISATGVFTEMETSINEIWDLKIKQGRSWKRMLRSKLLSFSMVAGLGFILLVSLMINSLMDGLMGKLQELFPHTMVVIVYIMNLLITLLMVSGLFAIIFKLLPHAEIRWKDVRAGALFSAILFMFGKFGIGIYISQSDIGSTYGSAGSIVILLLWIYYSSAILYFGAEFTKAYTLRFGVTIVPKEYATTIKIVEVESGAETVQENEKIKAVDLKDAKIKIR